ncbi:MAG: response regulator [Candidatus Nitrospinota bacterium M3_3B_026]
MSILVVDDEKSVRDMLGKVFAGMGIRSAACADGVEALEKLGQESYDLVIADIKMPRMDGMELLARIRKDHPGADILMMTSYATDYTYVDVVNAGAIDFIAKPFSVEEMKAKISRAERERRLFRELREANQRLEEAYAEIMAMKDDEEARCRQINYERERLLAERKKMTGQPGKDG